MLDSIGDTALRRTIGGLCIGNAGLAIHGTNVENVLTATAVVLTHNGVCNAFAAQTEIDLSAKTAYDEKGVALSAIPTLAAGYTRKYVLAANSSDAIIILCGKPMLTAQGDDADWPVLPAGYCPFGGIKVVNGTASAFTLGTTALNTASLTVTYSSLLTIPPRAV